MGYLIGSLLLFNVLATFIILGLNGVFDKATVDDKHLQESFDIVDMTISLHELQKRVEKLEKKCKKRKK